MKLEYIDKTNTENIISDALKFNCFDNISMQSCLIYGDNFKALSSLLKSHKGKIDLIYIDPPFNTNQVFGITQNRKNAISRSKNSIIAYSDEMTRVEFLEFIRKRLIILKELLSEEGSIYLHIDTKVGHYIKIIMDEIFGEENFKNDITRVKSNPKNFSRTAYGNEKDVIYFYAKNHKKNIWNEIKQPMEKSDIEKRFPKIDKNGRRYTTIPLHAPGETNGVTGQAWRGMNPPEGRHWRTNPTEFDKLDSLGLIEWSSTGNPRIIKFADEHKGKKIQDIWYFKDPQNPIYPTEKNIDMLKLIVQQSSREGSFVLDCFCGSGTTLLAAEELGRKWIGIDSSEVAISTIKNRKQLKNFQYFTC
ncbi:MAG: site-specific DNA-methyltransferase [Erysipelotrichaceae bacterium]|nr:site-specific DNA-methyltransferase [Erysipelotrichaceae bacterium]